MSTEGDKIVGEDVLGVGDYRRNVFSTYSAEQQEGYTKQLAKGQAALNLNEPIKVTNSSKGKHFRGIFSDFVSKDSEGINAQPSIIYIPRVRNFEAGIINHQFTSRGSVHLPLPEGIIDMVKPQWEQGSAQFRGMANSLHNVFGKSGWGGVLGGVEGLASTALAGKLSTTEGDKARGTIANTFEELYFKGLEFRTWTFTHKINPQSEKESNELRHTIEYLKQHAAPRLSDNQLRMEYPSEFKILFCISQHNNNFLPIIHQCVCEGIDVTYSPDGNQYFTDGAPTSIELQIQMKESILHTRDKMNTEGGTVSPVNNPEITVHSRDQTSDHLIGRTTNVFDPSGRRNVRFVEPGKDADGTYLEVSPGVVIEDSNDPNAPQPLINLP